MNAKKNDTQLVCIARFTAVEGEVAPLIENLRNLIPLTLQEGGCIRYELNQNIENENEITFIEKWYDQTTFDAHCNQPYIAQFFNDGKPLHVKEFDVSLHKQILF